MLSRPAKVGPTIARIYKELATSPQQLTQSKRDRMPGPGRAYRLDHSDTPGTEERKLILQRARQARYILRKRQQQQCQDHATSVRCPQCPTALRALHTEKLLARRETLSEQEVRLLDMQLARTRKYRARRNREQDSTPEDHGDLRIECCHCNKPSVGKRQAHRNTLSDEEIRVLNLSRNRGTKSRDKKRLQADISAIRVWPNHKVCMICVLCKRIFTQKAVANAKRIVMSRH